MISKDTQDYTNAAIIFEQLQALNSKLTSTMDEYQSDNLSEARYAELMKKIIPIAQAIFTTTKAPDEQWCSQAVSMAEMATIRCWMKWGAFDMIPVEGSISYKELAEKIDTEESLLIRMAGIMLSTGTLQKVGVDEIAHTHLSKVYITSHPSGLMFQMLWDEANVPYAHWPQYFEKYGRKEPKALTHNPFSVGYGKPDATVWEIRAESPQRVKDFAQTMNNLERLLPITGIYDFSWIAKKGLESTDRVLLVDVGGSRGQTINAIVKGTPGIDLARCVLQDRPEVIAHALPEIEGCQTMAHDFWTEQPVKGAAAYSIRRCLHDYPDDKSVVILSQLAKALAPDSRLLITEQIMESPPSPMAAQTDLCMLNIGGKERTEKNFHELAAASGLKILGIYKTNSASLGVIECVKA